MQIEEAIRRGDFAPGERLPSERELVQTFGVSRVSVREAIRSLEALGIVRVEQGRGAFVVDRRSSIGEALGRWLMLHRDEIFELYRVRGALDELASTCAAELGEPSAVAKLTEAHELLAEGVEQGLEPEVLMQRDIDFHLAIVEASQNRLLYDLSLDLHTYLAEARRLSFTTVGRPPQSVAEHARIVEAIAGGDPEAARRATRVHLTSIREVVVAAMERSGTTGHAPGS